MTPSNLPSLRATATDLARAAGEHEQGCGCPECEPDDECRCPHDGYHDGADCFCHHIEGCPEATRRP